MKIHLIRNATMVIDYAGKKMLVDPMFSKKGELARGPMPAKDWNWKKNPNNELPLPVSEIIKDIDFVFLTHLHFDHWDKAAEMALPKGYEKHASNSSRFAKSSFVRFEKRTRNWVVLHTMAFVAAFLEKINNDWVF
jgi:L-ascorbate metabolism protein UlaG (beta-lactamase superfamily)